MIDTSESLTLDTGARERATAMLCKLADVDFRGHACQDWAEDGICTVCWEVAAAVVRAAEGLTLCVRCGGMGTVGPEGDCCPQCGGDGLWPLDALGEKDRPDTGGDR